MLEVSLVLEVAVLEVWLVLELADLEVATLEVRLVLELSVREDKGTGCILMY